MPGTLVRASYTHTASVGRPLVKTTTLAFTPWLYGVNVPRGSRRTVCRAQSSQRMANTSPAWSANRQLSGSTTAARPPGKTLIHSLTHDDPLLQCNNGTLVTSDSEVCNASDSGR